MVMVSHFLLNRPVRVDNLKNELLVIKSSRKGRSMALNRIQKLGARVKKARKEQGLTQEQLAATTGVGVRFVRELEQGKESCHIGKALTVVAMLGISLTMDGEPL